MIKIEKFNSLEELESSLKEYRKENYYFLGEFLKEVDKENDELIVALEKNWENILLTCVHKNTDKLPKLSNIYYSAFIFENEIYDFYWKTIWDENDHSILRLHNYPKNYFPKRKLWKTSIKEKNEYIFTKLDFEWVTKVQVWPIHAWIIPPWHFRFTVDGENTLNLDIQLWWKYRWIEESFMNDKYNLEELLKLSEQIVWDSIIAHSLSFVKTIETSANINISEQTRLNRVILLELERIYNHLWTVWAILNDVGQWYLLNWFLEVREEFLKLNEKIFKSRNLSNVLNFWKNNIYLTKENKKEIIDLIKKQEKRIDNLAHIVNSSSWIYDRLYTTWIVKKETALSHSALWVWAKASTIERDYRKYDKYYSDIKSFKIITWENGDAYDRYYVRLNEIKNSFEIIKEALDLLENKWFIDKTKVKEIKLKDGYFIWQTEWHRWENLILSYIENGKIKYFKFKDPSFVNWTLLEYAVLNNIIADFPICNKSFDLSYSWFDV